MFKEIPFPLEPVPEREWDNEENEGVPANDGANSGVGIHLLAADV
jgi:hypothetical protein